MNRRIDDGRKAIVLGGILTALAASPALASTTWIVDASSAGCNNAGAGDAAVPFCSIQTAASKAGPGDTVLVNPGIYREQVTPKLSGAAGAPVVYQATAPGVVLRGTLNVTDPSGWAATSTKAWSRSFGVVPKQVFLDGVRLASAPSATATTAKSFFYDQIAKRLYVDIGGANPGNGHVVEAGAQTYGFNVVSLTDIVVDGFEMVAQNSAGVRMFGASSVQVRNVTSSFGGAYGIRVESSPSGVSVENCRVSTAGSNGILLLNTTGATVRGNLSHDNGFHGISLQGSSSNLVIANTSFGNVKPDLRSATGIDVNAASNNNTIQSNTVYSNQDSGIQVYNNSTGNLVVRNASFWNGDHGFDTNKSTGTRYVSNTSYKNFKDGFSVEGSSTDTTLANNIAVDNGLGTAEFDLYVDELSAAGFSSDFDLFWNSNSAPIIKLNGVTYSNLANFVLATGFEDNGISANPLFMDAATADLRLSPQSPAIDSADTDVAGFVSTDHDGVPPIDNPTVDNTGLGFTSYADRGAFETAIPPQAALALSDTSGLVNFTVTADASASVQADIDGYPIASYRFNFGDGTVVGPQTTPSAVHTFTVPGNYTIAVTVCDTMGICGRASSPVIVTDNPPVASLALSIPLPVTGVTLTANATATDTDGSPIASYKFNFGDGSVTGAQSSPSAVHKYSTAGTFTVTVTVTDTNGLSTIATSSIVILKNNAPKALLTVTPSAVHVLQSVTANASASTDTDLAPIATYTFDFGDGYVVGPQASPIAVHAFAKQGNYNVKVIVTDLAGLSSQAKDRVKVSR